jgi:hypothetical protein
VHLKTLYTARLWYPEGWSIEIAGASGTQWQDFYIAEGVCDGLVKGRVRGANHPQLRTDQTFVPDFQGIIETEDNADIFFSWHGYGRPYPVGARQIVGFGLHLSSAEDYAWLSQAVCAITGEVRNRPDSSDVDIVVEVSELIWDRPPE